MFVKKWISMRLHGDKAHRCILLKRSKRCPDTTAGLRHRLADTKYIYLFVPCCLKTTDWGVYIFVVGHLSLILKEKCCSIVARLFTRLFGDIAFVCSY